MSIKSFHSGKQLSVISAVDENLCVVSDRLREHRERPGLKFLLFFPSKLLFRKFRLWLSVGAQELNNMLQVGCQFASASFEKPLINNVIIPLFKT